MPYRLELTEQDLHTLYFVGHRYCCGSMLIEAIQKYEEWRVDNTNCVYHLPEHVAWQISEYINLDTEDGTTEHPLLAGELWSKLLEFKDSIV